MCGTTIGILQHPDLKEHRDKSGGHASPDFDVLIVDEASKTPFQEFLVPALLAKRWIIVGDPKQLSPYVDDEAMAVNIEACLPDVRGPERLHRRLSTPGVAIVGIDAPPSSSQRTNVPARRTASSALPADVDACRRGPR